MSFQEDALWDSAVLNSMFKNMNSVVVEIVEDDAFSDSEVLVLIFDNWLLEVSIEAKCL